MQSPYSYQLSSPPHPDLYLSIVIPCLNEKNLSRTLDSLYANEHGPGSVEVFIILNHGSQAAEKVKEQNEQTSREAFDWIKRHSRKDHTYWLIKAYGLPHKKAGVGMARKIGMDLAYTRMNQVAVDGVICNLDADCEVSLQYCKHIMATFKSNPSLNGASIFFEHRYDVVQNQSSIIQYELHLRLFVEALRECGFPFAFQTVGSSMACRKTAYLKQGGMSYRKAGEDFYFIQKLLRLGHYQDLVAAKVYPSSRVSDRVPFGTGKAMQDLRSGGRQLTYSLDNYQCLASIFHQLSDLYHLGFDRWVYKQDARYQDTYASIGLSRIVEDAMRNTGNYKAFRKRFCSNFDGFKVMKLLHYGRDHYWPSVPVLTVASQFLGLTGDAEDMLSVLRISQSNRPYYLDADLNAGPVE